MAPSRDATKPVGEWNLSRVVVKGNTVSCKINGAEVWSAPKDSLVMAGRLKSTDGAWGVRSAHNTDVIVSGLMAMKP